MVSQSLQYGSHRIPYDVVFVSRMRGKVAIHVLPTGLVRVQAPPNASIVDIKSGVARRARWIFSHLQRIRDRSWFHLPREYLSGESHLYLGRRHLLKVRSSASEKPSARLHRGLFQIVTNQPGRDQVRSLLSDWYRARAQAVFSARLAAVAGRLAWLHMLPDMKLLTMKRQWGSCSPRGVLRLNPHLVKAPPACIDYVLLHELCHLRHHNHSSRFYRTLSLHMPQWQAVKQRLDAMADQILSV